MGNVINYNSDQIAATKGRATAAASTAGEAADKAGGGFQGLEVLFGSGTKQISTQLGNLQGTLDNVQGIVGRQGESMFNRDTALGRAASEIEVPDDFVKNDANRFTQYHNELLQKTDGQSVNDGSGTRDTKEMDDSVIGKQKEMADITTSGGVEEQNYDESSGIAKEQDMANITTAGGAVEQEYDSRSGIATAESLGDITTAGGAVEQEYNSNSVVTEEQKLANINGAGGLEEQAVNTASLVNGQETMSQLDTTSGLTKQELIDKSRLNAQQALSNLKTNDEGLDLQSIEMAANAMTRSNKEGTNGVLDSFRNNYEDKRDTASVTSEEAIAKAKAAASQALDGLKM